jgi:hypothetical protein
MNAVLGDEWVYFNNHANHAHTLCGQNASFSTSEQVMHMESVGFKALMDL